MPYKKTVQKYEIQIDVSISKIGHTYFESKKLSYGSTKNFNKHIQLSKFKLQNRHTEPPTLQPNYHVSIAIVERIVSHISQCITYLVREKVAHCRIVPGMYGIVWGFCGISNYRRDVWLVGNYSSCYYECLFALLGLVYVVESRFGIY